MTICPKLLPTVVIIGLFAITGCGPQSMTLGAALDSPEHHVTNGLKLMAGDKMEAAMREFNRAAELDPNYSRAYFHMGMVYKVAHNWDRAIHYFQKVLNLKNGYEDEARREYDLIRQLQSQSGS